MQTGYHTLNELFAQLGLSSDDSAIEEFLAKHHLDGDDKLFHAKFLSESQRKFLRDAILDDSDWCEVVDELDALLRH